jgi:hypothetical protein
VPVRWTHLTGVYDAQDRQMRLYVNGVLAATATRTNPWRGSRSLTIGHVRYGAATADAFNGEIAQVRVWDRVVSAREAAPMAATLVGRWRLDGDGSDATGYARTAVPTAGVAWTEDRDLLPLSAARLAGAESLTTAGPVVRTDQSFTMTAWVSLDSTAAGAQIAVSQSGNRVHAARLGYYGTGTTYRWLFRTVPGDADTPGSTLYSTTPAEPGEWVHLAGVWEASTSTLRFYVNGLLEASAVTGSPFASTGPLTVGRNLVNGVYGESWRGAVDDVRLYAGALPATEIATLCAC